MTWDRAYREAARVIDETFGRPQGGRPMINASLTAAQLEQMIAEASDPKWTRGNACYCCWKCHKPISAAEATEVTLISGSKVYYCAKDYVARNHGLSQPFTAAQLEAMVLEEAGETADTCCVDCGGAFDETGQWSVGERRGWLCHACYERHVAGREPKAVSPPPVAKVPESRTIVYCSSAPPRELVESLLVRCGTGLEGGKPVMAPMVWTWKMRREWERHEAFRTATYNDEGVAFISAPAAPVVNGEYTPPLDADIYGGTVPLDQGIGGWRCRLCGGWLRRKVVVR